MIYDDADEFSRSTVIMAYVVAPTLNTERYLADKIGELSVREGMTTCNIPNTKIESPFLTKFFASSKVRKFLENKCPG